MKALWVVVRRELLIAIRHKTEVLTALFFFIVVTSLFPLAIGADSALLRQVGGGVIWVAALLSTLLALPRMFASDYEDGSLEQLLLLPTPAGILVAGKILSHWLVSALPLVLISPLLAIQFHLGISATGILCLSLVPGTLIFSLIGAIGATLTIGLRAGSVLLALLTLPLYTPVLIFGAGTIQAWSSGVDTTPYLSMLAALLALSLFFSPWAATVALRALFE